MNTTAPFSLDGFSSAEVDIFGGSGVDGAAGTKRNTALGARLTSVLSSSYADYEIRDALRLLDDGGVHNDEDTRRNLKANAQKQAIDSNAKIVDDFGHVAEVCVTRTH
jgi:hypothetical protein